MLPINNDDNFGRALNMARPLLRVIVQRKGNLVYVYEIVIIKLITYLLIIIHRG